MIEKSNESIDMEGPRRHLIEINKEEEEDQSQRHC